MTKRAMAIAPRIVLAGMVAGAAAAMLHLHPASAADDCLSKPKGTAPAGQHWYYHADRGTKHQCWYLGDQASHGASLSERKSAAVAHHHHQALSQSTADARAELTAPATDAKREPIVAAVATTPAEPAPMMAAAGPATMMPAPAADSSAVTQGATDNNAVSTTQSSLASRWPDATNTAQPVAATPANSQPVTAAAADSASAPAASVDSSTAAAAQDVSATNTDSSSTPTVASSIDSSRTRLAALLGFVAVAGFSTSVLLARARARRRIRLEPAGGRRRPLWPADADIDDMQLPEVEDDLPSFLSRGATAPRRADRLSIVPRDDARYDEQYEVEDLLARFGGQERRS